ncbi:hypothetical protein [uncultured Propionibacterium sp.]|uniref:hypothetical protein n=1 Tax=uncultured Propionibacterium sp. TaxID=218066 RepID=UPI002931E5B0|nr:hypothetical protein [uncultured Propionibacterium sp.]
MDSLTGAVGGGKCTAVRPRIAPVHQVAADPVVVRPGAANPVAERSRSAPGP